MSSKKQRIIIALDEKYINQLNLLKDKLKTKQYSKVIKYLLNIININN